MGHLKSFSGTRVIVTSPAASAASTAASTGLDQTDDEQPDLALPDGHAHVRGPDYYANHLSDKKN